MAKNQTSKNTASLLINKRNEIFDEIRYWEKYLRLYEDGLDATVEKKLLELEIESKKRLLPLEIKATPLHIINQANFKKELALYEEKQKLPRRAAFQKAKRQAKGGVVDKQAVLAKFDQEHELFKSELAAKYPTQKVAVSLEAVKAYETSEQEEAAKCKQLQKNLAQAKETDLKKEQAKIAKKTAQLQNILGKLNEQLSESYRSNASKMPEDCILSIGNIKMHFSGIKAVDDLSFDVREGEVFGLIGPNGAGKSTLFNCITQFYKAQEGQVFYRDQFNHVVNLNDYKSHDIAKTGIIRTFQNLALVPLLSVLDNLLIGAHIFYNASLANQLFNTKKLKYEEKFNRNKALGILENMGLIDYKDMLVSSLSYGILKKVELARTLMSNPRMIILDEPAAGLNDIETESLATTIKQISQDYQCTIFLVEHDMNLVMGICDTVCAISFGKMLAIGTPEEIQNNPLVQRAYLGEDGGED